MLRRTLLMLALGAVLMHAAPACVGGSDDTGLNPQPLPPKEPTDDKGANGESGGDTPPGRGTSGSSGSPTSGPADAGADAQNDGGG